MSNPPIEQQIDLKKVITDLIKIAEEYASSKGHKLHIYWPEVQNAQVALGMLDAVLLKKNDSPIIPTGEDTLNPEKFLYDRMVTQPDGFHDDRSYQEQMSCGYGDQIKEAMIAYAEQYALIKSKEVANKAWDAGKNSWYEHDSEPKQKEIFMSEGSYL